MNARRLGSPLLTLALAACSALGPGGREITLVNATDQPMVYLAVELQLSHTMDINPSFPVGPGQERLLAPGASATLEPEDIQGYRWGDDVRFFLYDVVDNEARYSRLLTLTHRDLALRGFRVRVS